MRSLRYTGIAVLAVLGLTTAGLGSAASAAPSASSSAASFASSGVSRSLAWTACGPHLECADVTVPLDWDEPRGPTITMPVLRYLAGHPERRIGSLFVLPSGPGDSGVELATSRGAQLDAATGGQFDVVGWDTRGTGGTGRVDCFGDPAAREAFWAGKPVPTTAAEQRRYLATTAEFSRRCGERNGDLLKHVATADNARDLDHLRQLVGDPKLTAFAESYGTYIGTTYANLFPAKLRAIVLDGMIHPVTVNAGTEAMLAAGLTDTDKVLEGFAAACEAAGPQRCALAGRGQPVMPRIQGFFERLRRGPLPAPNATPPGTLSFVEAMAPLRFAILGHPVLWPEAAAALEAGVEGDASAVKDAALFNQSELFHRLVEPGQAITCADSPATVAPAQWPAVVRVLERVSAVGGAPTGWQMGAACTTWPDHAEDRYTGPWNAHTSAPVLVVNNRYDPNAPLAGARDVARRLGGRLLVNDAYGHLVSNNPSACVTAAIGRYLVTQAAPPSGTVCRPDRAPFDPAFGTPTG
jgi:pimeloyl-ACP methyl ester carboxylesterase